MNMVMPVRFMDAMRPLLASSSRGHIYKKLDLSHRDLLPIDMFVEISPHRSLQRPVMDILRDAQSRPVTYVPLIIKDSNAASSALGALGAISCLGYPVCLARANGLVHNENPEKHYMALPDLPGYVFDHSQKYWDESRLR
jgi:acyl transferase domain-containing protein